MAPPIYPRSFGSLREWKSFFDETPEVWSKTYIAEIVESIRLHGLVSDFLGGFSPDQVSIEGENWRETLVVRGCNARVRAVLDIIANETRDNLHARILMLEAITPFALEIRGRYPFALGTEYLPTPEAQARHFPIPHCDIQDPKFVESSFDMVVSNDVLEHVSHLNTALRGMAKVLKQGGVMISTFPFAYMSDQSDVRAYISNGKIVHLKAEEYHGNPVDPSSGSLVFSVPGWDVIDRCKAAGFSSASILFSSSKEAGITGAEVAGIFVLRAVR